MKSLQATSKKTTLLLAFFAMALFSNKSFSQNAALQSRVAIVVTDTKTSIWVSDFPKKTTVMLLDNENNLLGIISTNDFGAAYTSFNKPVFAIVARTLNGEVYVTNKAVIKAEKAQDAIAASENKPTDKA